jgi:hypothetical protein
MPSCFFCCCRGDDSYGVLGDGTTGQSLIVPTVSGAVHKFSDFSLGEFHQCGLSLAGVMECWGMGGSGALGDGTTANRYTPGFLGGGYGGTIWISFQCGSLFTAAVDSAGKLFTWGLDSAGNLAQSLVAGTIKNVPTIITGAFPAFTQVAAGRMVTCGRTSTNRLYCSGDGTLGQTGTGSSSVVMKEVIAGSTSWQWGPYALEDTVIAAFNNAAPLNIFVWGLNDAGQCGMGSAGTNQAPPAIPTYSPTTFVDYSMGSHHACGLDSGGTGQVYCIGENTDGKWLSVPSALERTGFPPSWLRFYTSNRSFLFFFLCRSTGKHQQYPRDRPSFRPHRWIAAGIQSLCRSLPLLLNKQRAHHVVLGPRRYVFSNNGEPPGAISCGH